jgi:sensory rhodopsin
MAPTAYFGIGAAAMWVGTLAFVYIYLNDEANRSYHSIVTAVGAIAALCYTAMVFGLGVVTVNGTEIYLARYVQWVLGTPLIVLYLGILAGMSRTRIQALVAIDVLAMLTTPAIAVTTGAVRWGLFAAGSALFLVLLYGLLSGLESAAEDRPAAARALFAKLRNLTVVSWAFYPIVWFVGPFGVGIVDPASEVLLVTYLDVIAKIVFGFVAYNSRRAVEELPNLDALQGALAGS